MREITEGVGEDRESEGARVRRAVLDADLGATRRSVPGQDGKELELTVATFANKALDGKS